MDQTMLDAMPPDGGMEAESLRTESIYVERLHLRRL
jgi:hypothetical protein